MKNNEIRLYNVIFPIWMLWIIPPTWLVILPANLLIDFLVLYFTMKHLGLAEPKLNAKSVLFKSWICGFAADIIGTIGMFFALYVDFSDGSDMEYWWSENMVRAVGGNPFSSIFGFLWVTICVLIACVMIFLLNYKWCLRKLDIDKIQRKKIALSMAVFTAPVLFYLPTEWLY